MSEKLIALFLAIATLTSCADNSDVQTSFAETSAADTTSAATIVAADDTSEPYLGEGESYRKLSNPNATRGAIPLYNYINSVYHNGIISGQQESTWKGSDQYEFDYIYKHTGKYPAMRGLDYMGDDFAGVNSRAKEWHDKGGIVTICWHCGKDFSGSWNESMKAE